MGNWSKQDAQQLSTKEQMEEFMFLGLRMMEGVSVAEFWEIFGGAIEGIYGDVIQKLYEQGLLYRKDGRIALTKEGISVSNYVMAEFL